MRWISSVSVLIWYSSLWLFTNNMHTPCAMCIVPMSLIFLPSCYFYWAIYYCNWHVQTRLCIMEVHVLTSKQKSLCIPFSFQEDHHDMPVICQPSSAQFGMLKLFICWQRRFNLRHDVNSNLCKSKNRICICQSIPSEYQFKW